MDKIKAQNLLNKYLEGSCTAEEQLLVESWYNKMSRERGALIDEPDWEAVQERLSHRISSAKYKSRKNNWLYIAAAASIIFVTGIGAYLYISSKGDDIVYANDVVPGADKAILTLADGHKINLDNHQGELTTESGVRITKTQGGQITYTVTSSAHHDANTFNTIETPNGGQYIINLPDGSRVWLNAASSLKYPTSFAGKERKVQLKGEAYFEVAHNKAMPFIVAGGQQNVQVLGTHFNVNAYPNEASVNTTLLEGKVKVTGDGIDATLNPGQQAVVTTQTHQVRIQNADVESIMAWKKGDFVFKEESLESIMRKVSRWYDVDVVYEDGAPRDVTLGGWVSRSKNISAVLKIMQLTGKVHFKVEGRRVTVMH